MHKYADLILKNVSTLYNVFTQNISLIVMMPFRHMWWYHLIIFSLNPRLVLLKYTLANSHFSMRVISAKGMAQTQIEAPHVSKRKILTTSVYPWDTYDFVTWFLNTVLSTITKDISPRIIQTIWYCIGKNVILHHK